MRLLWLALALSLVSCSSSSAPSEAAADPLGPAYDDAVWSSADEGKEDSSASALVQQIQWDGFVIVPSGSDDATVLAAARRQVKSALGALLHYPKISLRDRDAHSAIDPSSLVRQPLQIVASDGKLSGSVDRVSYRYKDRALVPKTFKSTTFNVPMLFGDYASRAGELKPICSDDPGVEPDSLWFHYDPKIAACKAAIDAENTAINAATAKLTDAPKQLAKVDNDRRFLTVRAALTKVTALAVVYPEYDKLFGFGTDRTKIVVYSFFGVDVDDANPHDNGLVEDLRYVRTLRAAFPSLKVTETSPQAMMLDLSLDGVLIPGLTYERIIGWVLDDTGWPAAAASDSSCTGHFCW